MIFYNRNKQIAIREIEFYYDKNIKIPYQELTKENAEYYLKKLKYYGTFM